MLAEPLRRRRPILHPSRWPIVPGGLLIIAGSYLPWQTITWPQGAPEVTTGLSTFDAPGLELILLFAATLAMASLPSVAGSRTRLVQLSPAILGVATALIALAQYQKLSTAGGPTGPTGYTIDGGFWLAGLGALLVAVGGLAASYVISRDRPLLPEDDAEPGAGLLILPPLIALVGGLILGTAAAVILTPSLGPAGSIVAPLVMLVATVASALLIHAALKAIWPSPEELARRARQASRGGDLPELEPVRREDDRS